MHSTRGGCRRKRPGRCEHLLDGGFLERAENALVFGNPGSGKTHIVAGRRAGTDPEGAPDALHQLRDARAGTADCEA